MVVPSHTVRGALNEALDLQPLNHQQALVCFNPDREINSLAERVAALQRFGVPIADLRAIFADIRQVLELNALEGEGARRLAGQLDELATAIANVERNEATMVEGASTKKLAIELRAHLRVLRETPADGVAYFQSAAAVKDIVRCRPRSQLLSPTMRNQLRKGPFAQLEAIIESIGLAHV